ncbi:mitochondrial ATP synthase g subunit-domain-containing protein [Cyathus striatus]|nr:mitochondrial ATP synthase g subunit-domain-containing protein [Cyathus striatus]
MRSSLPASLLRQSLARNSLRQQRRFASSEAEKKAQDALATAQKTAGNALEGAKKLLEPVGRKLGQMLGSYKQPIVYNLAVAREVAKLIYRSESLQPPSIAAVRAAYESIWAQVRNPAAVRGLLQSGEIAQVGIYGLQAYGIFKIGEIIGRRSLVGYDLH